MAISPNAYGSIDEVAGLVGRYTNDGEFDDTTNPKLAQVEKFINRVSAIVNTLLAEEGFVIPISATEPKLVMDEFVIAQVCQLCDAANGAGGFAPGNEEFRHGHTPFQIITGEAASFIGKHANGLEALGAARNKSQLDGLACRTTDDSGAAIVPV